MGWCAPGPCVQVAAAPHWFTPGALNYSSVECCDLRPGQQFVDYNKDCHASDVMATNFTAVALHGEGGKAGSAAPGLVRRLAGLLSHAR